MMTPDAGAGNLRCWKRGFQSSWLRKEKRRSTRFARERGATWAAPAGPAGAVSDERGIFLPSPSTTVFGPYYHRRSLLIASR